MAKRARRNKGFNTPFADLQLPKADSAAAPAPAPRGQPTAARRHDESRSQDECFAQMVGPVRPLTDPRHRIEPVKQLTSNSDDEDALALAELKALVRGDAPFELAATGAGDWGLAPGVSRAVLARLQAGGFAFRRHIDLHGYSREDAHLELTRFIKTARHDLERCVLVVTGRGKRSPGGVSVLREALPRWLSRAPLAAHVLGFCTARAVDGGLGAFYVLLRRAGTRPYGVSL